MKNVDIEIPADAKTVTLALRDREQQSLTLRSILPQIKGNVELVVVDEFKDAKLEDAEDWYRLRADSGSHLMGKLLRSRIVDGEFLLCQFPIIRFGMNMGAGVIQLWVRPPVPDDGD